MVDLRHYVRSGVAWIVNQARPDIANAVRAMARIPYKPKPTHYKAAHKIIEYLNVTSDLRLTFSRDSDLGSVQLEFHLETYVHTDYAHIAEDKRSVCAAAISCGVAQVSWFSGAQQCVTLSTNEAEYVAMADGVREARCVRGVSDAHFAFDEHWHVRGQQGGDRLRGKSLGLFR